MYLAGDSSPLFDIIELHFLFFCILKLFTLLASLFLVVGLHAQINPPFDFETEQTTPVLTNFEMAETMVVENPDASGINTSANVAQMVRYPGGNVWAGSIVTLPGYLDLTEVGAFRMKVYSPVAGAVMKLKLEGNGVIELDALTTVENAWETLVWDFTGVPGGIYNQLAFMLDYGTEGDGTYFSTFYFDDVELYQSTMGLQQVSLPIDHEDESVHYQTTSFAGNYSELVVDPMDENNHVMKVTKHWQSLNYSGTTMSTPAGLAVPIPFESGATEVSVDVWVPTVGAAIRLKAEEAFEPANSVETQQNVAVAGEWTTMTFDFYQNVPGTQTINFNYDYTILSIFFDFGNEGYLSGIQDFYYDNVVFNGSSASIAEAEARGPWLYPSSVSVGDYLNVSCNAGSFERFRIFSTSGQIVYDSWIRGNTRIGLSGMASGVYICQLGEDRPLTQKITVSQ